MTAWPMVHSAAPGGGGRSEARLLGRSAAPLTGYRSRARKADFGAAEPRMDHSSLLCGVGWRVLRG